VVKYISVISVGAAAGVLKTCLPSLVSRTLGTRWQPFEGDTRPQARRKALGLARGASEECVMEQ
jgi:hypothetical protein